VTPAGERSGFDARFTPYLRAAEDRHFWFRARNTVIGSLVRRIVGTLPPRYRVLEPGCGTGNTLRVLEAECRPGSVVGMDVQHDGLLFARERVRAPLVQGDVACAPFGRSVRFDLIALFDVIEHLDDDTQALTAIHAMLAPGGAVLLTVPADPKLWSSFDVAAHHRRRYTRDTLHGALASAGFRVEYSSPFMTALYPLAWGSRRIASRSPSSASGDAAFQSVVRDLRVIPIVNPALTWLLSREAAILAAGRRLPFGVSLVAIARAD